VPDFCIIQEVTIILDCRYRLAFAGARRGDFPKVIALINIKYSTPMVSLIVQVSNQGTSLYIRPK